MHKKLLASDWDGTIFHREMRDGLVHSFIKQEDILAIKDFRQQGHYFALCTGRTPNSIKRALMDFPDLEVDGFILASGGAIYQATRQHPIEIEEAQSFWIPAKDAKDFVRYFHDTEKYTVYWSTKNTSYGLLERDPSADKSHNLTMIPLEEWCQNPEDVISFGLTPFSHTEEDALEAISVITKKWGKTMTGFRNMIYVDVSAAGINKGTGIHNLNRLLDNNYTCYGVGDAQNDIPMFEAVGKDRAFRMRNGVKELEKVAGRAVDSIADCIQLILQDD